MLLRAWLAAAHGQALVTADDRADSHLRYFDDAAEVLPFACTPDADAGMRSACVGDPNLVPVLMALRVHNVEVTRVEAALRVGLVFVYLAGGDTESATALLQDVTMIARTVRPFVNAGVWLASWCSSEMGTVFSAGSVAAYVGCGPRTVEVAESVRFVDDA